MNDSAGQFERTISLGERALAHIRSHRSAAHPRAYELWYTYITGTYPSLTRAMNEILTKSGRVTQAEVDELYERFLHVTRSVSTTQKATTRLLSEMTQIDSALSSARAGMTNYRSALNRAVGSLDSDVNIEQLRRLATELLRHTNEAERNSAHLSDRLAEATTELASLRDKLEAMRVESQTDPVTAVLNRQTFDNSLNDVLARSAKTGDIFALLMVDIDFFKAVNDTFGHLTGDQVLRLVAQTIRHNLKGHDLVARFGGEEFVAIMPHTSLKDAAAVAEKLRVAVMSRELVKRSTGQNLGRVTISIGVSAYRPGDTPSAIIDRADRNLYLAKHDGRNRVMALEDTSERIAEVNGEMGVGEDILDDSGIAAA